MGYTKSASKTIIHTKHSVDFHTGVTARELINFLKQLPEYAALESVNEHDDKVRTWSCWVMEFTEESAAT